MGTERPSRLARAARIARLVGGVLSAQALAQLLMLVSGFLLLRWLSVEQYAQYTIAFAFVATLTTLIDLGFAGAIMPLVANRARDARLFGAYVRAALRLRTSLAAVVLPPSAVVFFLLTSQRGWGVGVQAGLFATVALGLLARTLVDIYSLPLLMNDAYRRFYAPQMSTAILRVASHALLQVTRQLTSVSASLVNSLAALANGARVSPRFARSHRAAEPGRSGAHP